MKLDVIDGKIQFEGGSLIPLYRVLDARDIEGKIIIVYDYAVFSQSQPARNVFAYSKSGVQLWQSGDIGMGTTDAYTNVLSETPLKVGNFAGYSVLIDINTGKVIGKEFTK